MVVILSQFVFLALIFFIMTPTLDQSTESTDGDGCIQVSKSSNREDVSSIAFIQSAMRLTRIVD